MSLIHLHYREHAAYWRAQITEADVTQTGPPAETHRLPDVLQVPGEDVEFLRTTAFGLLQGSRMRNIKTEYVSCPSCGRTLFDLQEVTEQVCTA